MVFLRAKATRACWNRNWGHPPERTRTAPPGRDWRVRFWAAGWLPGARGLRRPGTKKASGGRLVRPSTRLCIKEKEW